MTNNIFVQLGHWQYNISFLKAWPLNDETSHPLEVFNFVNSCTICITLRNFFYGDFSEFWELCVSFSSGNKALVRTRKLRHVGAEAESWKLKAEAESWKLKLKGEAESRSWKLTVESESWKLKDQRSKLTADCWSWNLKLKSEAESWSWKLKTEVEIWSWKPKLKS